MDLFLVLGCCFFFVFRFLFLGSTKILPLHRSTTRSKPEGHHVIMYNVFSKTNDDDSSCLPFESVVHYAPPLSDSWPPKVNYLFDGLEEGGRSILLTLLVITDSAQSNDASVRFSVPAYNDVIFVLSSTALEKCWRYSNRFLLSFLSPSVSSI